jgi:hypothetical protein
MGQTRNLFSVGCKVESVVRPMFLRKVRHQGIKWRLAYFFPAGCVGSRNYYYCITSVRLES